MYGPALLNYIYGLHCTFIGVLIYNRNQPQTTAKRLMCAGH